MQYIAVNLPVFLLVLVLLWLPRQWLHFGKVIKRNTRRSAKLRATEPWKLRDVTDPSVDFATEFGKVRNYIDLLRAATASVFLMGLSQLEPCFGAVAAAPRGWVWGVVVAKGLIFVVALLLQTVRYEKDRLTFYPPIFFLAGLSVGLCTPWAALAAFVLIWALNPLFPNSEWFLTAFAALTVALGYQFSGFGDKSSLLEGILCFLPVLLSVMARRPLRIFARKTRSADEES